MSASISTGPILVSPASGRGAALRALVVDDDKINQRLALRILSFIGLRAEVAGNGADALAALRKTPFDVVFMDLQMPQMGGLEATRLFRAEQRPADVSRPWIIALTANSENDIRTRCLAAGMNDFVSKPVSIDTISAAINRAVAGLAASEGDVPGHAVNQSVAGSRKAS